MTALFSHTGPSPEEQYEAERRELLRPLRPGEREAMPWYGWLFWFGWIVFVISALYCLLSMSCDVKRPPEPQSIPLEVEPGAQAAENARYRVVKVAEFRDPLAYDGVRGVYEVHDEQTGAVYLGVSGIGIAEVGSHHVGAGKARHRVEDER